jgi:hypothetical protein
MRKEKRVAKYAPGKIRRHLHAVNKYFLAAMLATF